MFGERVAVGVHAGGYDRDLAATVHLFRLLGEKGIPRDNAIAARNNGAEAVQAARTVKAFRRIRIAQPDSIVEVEQQAASPLTQQTEFESRQKFSLQNNRVRTFEIAADAEPIPQTARQRMKAKFV